MTGGVSINERDFMSKKSSDYNLKIVSALLSGHYVADVRIKIEDTSGKEIIEIVSQGPWFFVKLAAGDYRIHAVYKDLERVQKIRVGKSLITAIFHWKNEK
jgi:hypothetical protein